MTEPLIQAENVGKKFCRDLKKSLWYGVRDSASDLLGRRPQTGLRAGEFWANEGISFEVSRGDCLGLIGRNGAGKTTLLKMLSGLIKPDHGEIRIRGQVGGLIALGAGFNPILSGRENIFVNGSIMGLSKKQIADKVDEIVDFAEMGQFIDTPVRNYSSGMNVRLGFAIAATLIRPDVLLLDEVLAVGDAGFRARCYSRVHKLMSTSAVILVSHTMGFIGQCCSSVGLMTLGNIEIFDDVTKGIGAYDAQNATTDLANDDRAVRQIYPPVTGAEIQIITDKIAYGEDLEIEIQVDSEEDIGSAVLSFVAYDHSEKPVMCWHSSQNDTQVTIKRGRQSIRICIAPLLLASGTYSYTFNMSRPGSIEHLVWYHHVGTMKVTSPYQPVGQIPYLPHTNDYSVSYDAGSRLKS